MTNFENMITIIEKTKENIIVAKDSIHSTEIDQCLNFSADLQIWIEVIKDFSNIELVNESYVECKKSILLCVQGFYKESIFTLRQFLEHMLFAIKLSTDDYKYKLWVHGQLDMSWTSIVDREDGVFGKRYIKLYAGDLYEERSMELTTIAKNVYRECSEFVHGNYGKISDLSNEVIYDEKLLEQYLGYFSSIQYIISMALFIRFRDQLGVKDNLSKLEQTIMDNIGMIPEIQALYGLERGEVNE